MKGNLLSAFVLFVVCCGIVSAQTTFQKTYGGSGKDNGTDVQVTNDGGFIMAGYTKSFGVDSVDAYLVKTDVNGAIQWAKTYGGLYDDRASSVKQTKDSGYIFTGYTTSFGAGAKDVYLVKTDKNGNRVWERTFGGANDDEGRKVMQTADGGYVVAGYNFSLGAVNALVNGVCIIKTNASGDSLWTKVFAGPSLTTNDVASSIDQTFDGGYIIAGTAFQKDSANSDICLLKIDVNGNFEWDKFIGGPASDAGASVQQTTDSGFIIAGTTNGFGVSSNDAYLVKTNKLGAVSWSRTFGGGSEDEGLYGRQTADGGYFIIGEAGSFGPGIKNFYFVKTDANGDTLWTKGYASTSNDIDIGFSGKQTADGGYILAGYSAVFHTTVLDMYLIKTDANGNAGCGETRVPTIQTSPVSHAVSDVIRVSTGGSVSAPVSTVRNGGTVNTVCAPVSSNGRWTWISGEMGGSSAGVFGQKGVPSVNNHPPGIYEAVEWKDKAGNFWIYGGTIPYNTDLWKLNPLTLEWTWVKGNGLPDQLLHAAKGVADTANRPGQRSYTAATWVDTSGALWLFGGAGRGDDLWKYDIASGKWTWVSGDTTADVRSFHGSKGTATALTTPGNRYSTCSAWTDSANNLWLFGGFGYDDNGQAGGFDDLWKYSISAGKWTWVNGSKDYDPLPVYGSKGVAAAGNELGGRFSYTKWKDIYGDFWVMGGIDYDLIHFGVKNDLWKYDVSADKWAWMGGDTLLNNAGTYHAACSFDAANVPDSRAWHRSAVTDNCGKFWLFGGEGDDSVLNDLWVYDPQLLKWNLANRTHRSQPGSYGSLGVPSPSNMPPARFGAVAWWGNDNRFYLFGGQTNNNATIYSDVWVFTPDTNCTPFCNTVAVVSPAVNFQSTTLTFCAVTCIGFTNLSTNATSWKWTFTGGNPSTSTEENPQSICYAADGFYDVKLVASNEGASDSVTLHNYLHVIAYPPTPIITQSGATLYCSTDSSYTSYQWYDSTALLQDEVDTFLVITHAGDYSVEVANANGCKVSASTGVPLGWKPFTVYPPKDGFAVANSLPFTVSPNPVRDELRITISESAIEKIEIYNVLGMRVYSCEPETVNRKPETVLPVSALSPGIYFIRVANGAGIGAGRFVKE